MLAKIYDADPWAFGEEQDFIIREVDKIEGPCKLHDYTVIWYSNGFQSYSFELLEN